MLNAVVLALCLISNVLGTDFEKEPFVKKDYSYQRVINNPEGSINNISNDFVPTISKLLDDIKNGTQVDADSLNKFSDGITQYYLSRALEYYFYELKLDLEVPNYIDPIILPNITFDADPAITFFDVKVYGFPPFKSNYKVISELNSSPYFQDFQVLFKAQSDTVIFTTSFHVYGETYFLVYITSINTYSSEHVKVREPAGMIKSKLKTDVFRYSAEEFHHTYDACLEHYKEVDEKVELKFVKALETVYLPRLAQFADMVIAPKFESSYPKFSSAHRQRVLHLLVESAAQYLRLKGFKDFAVRPMSFTNQQAAARNRPSTLEFDEISVDGLLNYVKYEFSDAGHAFNNSLLRMSDKFTFYYPDSGETQACVTVVVKTKHHSSVKKFRIISIAVETAVVADLAEFPPKLSRDKAAFESTDPPVGFRIEFNMELEEDVYYFVIKHSSNDLTLAVDSFLFGNGTVLPFR